MSESERILQPDKVPIDGKLDLKTSILIKVKLNVSVTWLMDISIECYS